MKTMAALVTILAAGCSPSARSTSGDDVDARGSGSGSARDASLPTGDGPDNGCGGLTDCYSVYAHSDDTLYLVDLTARTLATVGSFKAPKVSGQTDVITDLAVAPDGTIWVISETALYTASATDGHVTPKGSLAACGTRGVALTFTPGGKLYTGDFKGAICEIDLSGGTPVVGAAVTLSGGMALSGDLVAVGNGTVFGTLYKLSDNTGSGTNLSNVLGTIDLASGQVTSLGATGYPKLFGTSFANNHVIGFTHDGTGDVIEIDPATGSGSLFATFSDPDTGQKISFAGAGVNALVPIVQ